MININNHCRDFFILSNYHVQSTTLQEEAKGIEPLDAKSYLQDYWSNPGHVGFHLLKNLQENQKMQNSLDQQTKLALGLAHRLCESLKDGDPADLVEKVSQYTLKFFDIKKITPYAEDPLLASLKKKIEIIETKEFPHAKKEQLNELIDLDLRMILSKPLGRLLITRVLMWFPHKERLYIHPSAQFHFSGSPGSFLKIGYNLTGETNYQISKEIYSAVQPSFMNLAHELMHVAHFFEYSLLHNPTFYLDEDSGNAEEVRTLHNISCCSLHPFPDPCNEFTLRQEFNLDPRLCHRETLEKEKIDYYNQAFRQVQAELATPMEIDEKPSSSKQERL